jgi:hypothetical protein
MARPAKTDPVILEMPDRTMAVVRTVGDPNETAGPAMKALYGGVYGLKFARKKAGLADFKITGACARWSVEGLPVEQWSTAREHWVGLWALPVPDDVTAVPAKDPAGLPVTVERWTYGTVAQILHLGPYADEPATIERLHAFIAEQGYAIAGPHEEEYLTRPDAKEPKALIRYAVTKRA